MPMCVRREAAVGCFERCDDDDMRGWIRSYRDEKELTFVWEVGDGG
jgi:hypothetical protein